MLRFLVKLSNLFTILFSWFEPLAYFGIRAWLFKVFFSSGWQKYTAWETTKTLFETEYQVPYLKPITAAVLGTGAEILFPVLLLLGLGARLPALGLFILNIVAVISYSDFLLKPENICALKDHIAWGFMILVILVSGHSKISIDHLFRQLFPLYKY
jgi:putative oxidoreductase